MTAVQLKLPIEEIKCKHRHGRQKIVDIRRPVPEEQVYIYECTDCGWRYSITSRY